jgi:hypothetical protein
VATTRPWSLLRSSCRTCTGFAGRGSTPSKRRIESVGRGESRMRRKGTGRRGEMGGRGWGRRTDELEADPPGRALHHGHAGGARGGRGGEGPRGHRQPRHRCSSSHRRIRARPRFNATRIGEVGGELDRAQ